ncbi:RCC1 domain-containing protein [Sandaracinus amylolyticus]|nr:RCC1 domain-containing protein [Sandaracinus amylolyticus]
MDGTSSGCTVEETEAGAVVTCDDGTSVTVPRGVDGSGCTLTDHGDGSATLTCDDGTSVTLPIDGPLHLGAGSNGSCATRADGTLRCWGSAGILSVPPGRFVEVRGFHNDHRFCARRPDHTVACWGNPDPLSTPLGETFTRLYGHDRGMCGMRADGTLRCWGAFGPIDGPPTDEAFVDYAFGFEWGCGVRASDGTIRCWGGPDPDDVPTPPTGAFVSIVGSLFDVCGRRADGTVACSGALASGAPAEALGAISAGQLHACGIRASDASLVCWGRDAEGQHVVPPGRFVEVVSGGRHSCALDEADEVHCWGDDTFGQASVPDPL